MYTQLNVKAVLYQTIQSSLGMQFKSKYIVWQKHIYFNQFSLVKQFSFSETLALSEGIDNAFSIIIFLVQLLNSDYQKTIPKKIKN